MAKATKKAEKAVHSLKIRMNPRQFLEAIESQQDTETGIVAKVPPKVLLAWRDTEDWKAFTERLNETETGKLKQVMDDFKARRDRCQKLIEKCGGENEPRPQLSLGEVSTHQEELMATKIERERRKLEKLPASLTPSTILAGVKRPTRECREAVLKLAKIPKAIDENNDKLGSWMKTGSRPSSTSTRASASSGSRAASSESKERVKLQPNALALLPVKTEKRGRGRGGIS